MNKGKTMTLTVSILIAVTAIVFFVVNKMKTTPPGKAIIIQKPKLGLLNLSGEKFAKVLQEDKSAFQNLFWATEVEENGVVQCDVLFIYGEIGGDGKLVGSPHSLREIIRDSKAAIVVVAVENNTEAYILAAKEVGFGSANLVMTLERKGANFQTFFRALFVKMTEGIPMPLAWVEIAPQGPNGGGENNPATIFSAELGQVLFFYEPK